MRYKCIIQYDGSLFLGFQTQSKGRSVQEELETALVTIFKHPLTIRAAGRTDGGVHALGQVIHVDSNIDIPANNLKKAINSLLPNDIYVKEVEIVDETFHAQYGVVAKEYHYCIDLGEYNPLYQRYRYYPKVQHLDVTAMMEAAKHYLGTHDFRSFTKNNALKNTIRTIHQFDIIQDENLIVIKIIGNGFMHHMIRILVAMLVECGAGKITPDRIKWILGQKNRIYAPKIAPSAGLTLVRVFYNENCLTDF